MGNSGAKIGDGTNGDNSNNPDPLDRMENVARSSLAGSLRLVSAAMRGVGDAVFQAGTVAEGLAGGTGQVAGEGRWICTVVLLYLHHSVF